MCALLNFKKENVKMTDDERILECQKEIKRLRQCVRQYEDELENIRKNIDSCVASDEIFSPQNYLMVVTGNCFMIDENDDIATIKNILKQTGNEKLKSFSLNEVYKAALENCRIVLVDCMVYDNNQNKFLHKLQWFEVNKTNMMGEI